MVIIILFLFMYDYNKLNGTRNVILIIICYIKYYFNVFGYLYNNLIFKNMYLCFKDCGVYFEYHF
jgi:hypothetical protein